MMCYDGESLTWVAGGNGETLEWAEVTSELKFEKLSINPRSGGRAFQKLCWP